MKNQILKQAVSWVSGLALAMFAMSPALAQSATASLLYSPTSKSVQVNTNFTLDIKANTAAQDVAGVDAVVIYDPDYLTLTAADNGSTGGFIVGPLNKGTDSNGNSMQVVSWLATPVTSGAPTYLNSTSAQVASLHFDALQVGTTTLSFYYTGNPGDSTIATPAGTDIISSSNGTATITITEANTGNETTDGPVITSIIPTKGDSDYNQTVAIYGSNFGDYVEGSSKVYLGTKLVDVLDWTDTRIEILVSAEPDLEQDSTRQVKVHRSDGEEATYMGYTLVASGPEMFIWLGIFLAALGLSWLAYRKLNPVAAQPVLATSYQTLDTDHPNITYRF